MPDKIIDARCCCGGVPDCCSEVPATIKLNFVNGPYCGLTLAATYDGGDMLWHGNSAGEPFGSCPCGDDLAAIADFALLTFGVTAQCRGGNWTFAIVLYYGGGQMGWTGGVMLSASCSPFHAEVTVPYDPTLAAGTLAASCETALDIVLTV